MAADTHAWRHIFTLLDVFRRWTASVNEVILVRDGCEVGLYVQQIWEDQILPAALSRRNFGSDNAAQPNGLFLTL